MVITWTLFYTRFAGVCIPDFQPSCVQTKQWILLQWQSRIGKKKWHQEERRDESVYGVLLIFVAMED